MIVHHAIIVFLLNIVAINAKKKRDDSFVKPTEYRHLTTEDGSRLRWITRIDNTTECTTAFNDFTEFYANTDTVESDELMQSSVNCYMTFTTLPNVTDAATSIAANFDWMVESEADRLVTQQDYSSYSSVDLEDEENYYFQNWALYDMSYTGRQPDLVRFDPLYNGSGVLVFLLDTAVRVNNAYLEDRVIQGPSFVTSGSAAVADPTDAGYGYSSENSADDLDISSHGTYVSSLMIGGNIGVARGATVNAIEVLDSNGMGGISGVVNGVNHAIDTANGAPGVLVMPFTTSSSSSIKSVVKDAYLAGLVVIAAAGNDGGDACNYSPANVEAVITVGSYSKSRAVSGFSNQKSCVDIFAPGYNIECAQRRSYTNRLSGTSMSTGFVAGAMISLMQKHNNDRLAAFADLMQSAKTNELTNLKSGSPNRKLQLETKPKPLLCGSPSECFEYVSFYWPELDEESLYLPVVASEDATDEMSEKVFVLNDETVRSFYGCVPYSRYECSPQYVINYVPPDELLAEGMTFAGEWTEDRVLYVSNETAAIIQEKYMDGLYLGGPPFRVPTGAPTPKPTMAPTVKDCDAFSTKKSKCQDNNKCTWDATATPPCQLKPAYL